MEHKAHLFAITTFMFNLIAKITEYTKDLTLSEVSSFIGALAGIAAIYHYIISSQKSKLEIEKLKKEIYAN